MTKSHLLLWVFAACLLDASIAETCELAMTIRAHTDRLLFGDPLYVEVTITNRGDTPVAGILPAPDLGSLEFMISEVQGHLSYRTHSSGALAGAGTPEIFEPGKPRTYYFTLMFPRYLRFNHIFWKRFQDAGDELAVQALYGPRWLDPKPPKDIPLAEGTISRIGHDVHIVPRPKRQIERLQFWVEREIDPKKYKKGPTPSHFGLPVHVANREEMGSFAFDTVLDGELGGLAVLSLKFRDIYDLPPESREAANGELVEWLRKEPPWKRVGEAYMIPRLAGGLEPVHLRPEIKRMALAHLLRGNAQSYNMRSTAAAMKELVEEPAFAGDETTQEDGVD